MTSAVPRSSLFPQFRGGKVLLTPSTLSATVPGVTTAGGVFVEPLGSPILESSS